MVDCLYRFCCEMWPVEGMAIEAACMLHFLGKITGWGCSLTRPQLHPGSSIAVHSVCLPLETARNLQNMATHTCRTSRFVPITPILCELCWLLANTILCSIGCCYWSIVLWNPIWLGIWVLEGSSLLIRSDQYTAAIWGGGSVLICMLMVEDIRKGGGY